MTIFRINKTVYLDKFTKCYKNIFYINNPPNNSIFDNITKNINTTTLSPFKTFQSCCDNKSCLKVFININDNELLLQNQIDILFSQLINNGFNIEYKLTKLIDDKDFVCFVSK
mgnify:CR=1 FL=1|jgi:hypothetical protein